ncbi:MAG: hypothetical protein AB1458_04200 [Bacteroidota bacterium]
MIKRFFIPALILFAVSCKKDDPGKGGGLVQGDAIVTAQVMHHFRALPNIKVYIKKGATSFPGRDSTLYDSYQVSDPGGFVRFDKLANGAYYFYAEGFDEGVWMEVWGYVPFNIDNRPGEVKEYDVTIPVSE